MRPTATLEARFPPNKIAYCSQTTTNPNRRQPVGALLPVRERAPIRLLRRVDSLHCAAIVRSRHSSVICLQAHLTPSLCLSVPTMGTIRLALALWLFAAHCPTASALGPLRPATYFGPRRLRADYGGRGYDSLLSGSVESRLVLRGGGHLHEQWVDLGNNGNVHVVANAGEVTFKPNRDGLELRWGVAQSSKDEWLNPKKTGTLGRMIPAGSVDEKSKGIRTAFPQNQGALSISTRDCKAPHARAAPLSPSCVPSVGAQFAAALSSAREPDRIRGAH